MKKLILMLVLVGSLLSANLRLIGAANVIRTNLAGNLPWKIDTVGTLTTKVVRIDWIVWYGCTADGHDFILTGTDGNLVHEDTDGEEGKPHVFYPGTLCESGLVLQKLDSGYLLIGVSYR